MDILKHIYELLKTQKNVSLFGFGTFCKVKSPGHYDSEKQFFLPPTYHLRFIVSNVDDGLLTAYIAQQKNISHETVNYFLNKLVEELNQKLIKYEKVDLFPLGKINSVNGNLIFTEYENLDLGSEFFGLPSFKTDTHQVVIQKQEEVLQQETLISYEDIQEIPPVIEAVTETLLTEEQERELSEERKHNILTWIIVLVLLFATAITIYNFYKVEVEPGKKARKLQKEHLRDSLFRDSLLKDSVERQTKQKDSLLKLGQSLEKEQLRRDSLKKDSVKVAEESSKQESYEIVVIAVKTQKVAEEQVNHYQKMGFSPKIIQGKTPKMFKRVSIASFATQEQAKNFIKENQNKLNKVSINIYKNSNK